jgi:hypothetical protein
MMNDPSILFPSGVTAGVTRSDVDAMYLKLQGRLATEEEATILADVQASWPDAAHKGAAVCTVGLTNLEAVGAN